MKGVVIAQNVDELPAQGQPEEGNDSDREGSNGSGDTPNQHADMLTGSQMNGTAYTGQHGSQQMDEQQHWRCGEAILDRMGLADTEEARSWNISRAKDAARRIW